MALMLMANLAAAQQFDSSKIYFGGGLSQNSLSGFDDATGYQVFGGYPLDVDLGGGQLSVEVGYMDSGSFEYEYQLLGTTYTFEAEATGFWSTAVGEWQLNESLNLIGRLGMDIGDDDGIMFGGGVGYNMTDNIDLRGEYVVRNNVDSLQVNFVYYP